MILGKELEGEIAVDDDNPPRLGNGGLQERVFVVLGRFVGNTEQTFDAADTINKVFLLGGFLSVVVHGTSGLKAVVQQLDELIDREGDEGFRVCFHNTLRFCAGGIPGGYGSEGRMEFRGFEECDRIVLKVGYNAINPLLTN